MAAMFAPLGERHSPDSGRNDLVDFTRSIPPLPDAIGHAVASTLRDLADREDLALLIRHGVAGGSERDKAAGSAWLSTRFGQRLPPGRIVVANGTQSVLLILFEALVGRDGLLLAEALSYTVLADLAARAHIRLRGLAIDRDGILPDAFEAACRQERPRALYCNPTVQNPTTAIMPEERRRAIAAIARRFGVAIIEDDPLGCLHPDAPPPIAAVGPDVTWYVMGLTKCLAHGLRIAYLVGPTAQAVGEVIEPVRRLSHWIPAPLVTPIVNDWIERGVAAALCGAIRKESEARHRLALAKLAGAEIETKPGALHLWLHLPDRIGRHGFVAALHRSGVLVRPSDLFAVDGAEPPNAVRLSLSSPLDRDTVARGLDHVVALLGLSP